jgi:hypothetical protein
MTMSFAPLAELVDGLPNLCGAEAQVEEVTRARPPVFLPETNLHLDRLQAVFAVELHMHQPLIPAGGGDLRRLAFGNGTLATGRKGKLGFT